MQNFEKLGKLDVLRVTRKNSRGTIVLFHGYGANAQDLYPLYQYIDRPGDYDFIFAQGPVDLGMGARCWFHIDTQALEAAMASGTHRDLTGLDPDGLATSRNLALEMLAEIQTPQVYLGGFSQGAMLATDLTLESDLKLEALFILSGTLLKRERWQQLAPARKGLPFIQSHGDHDMLLSPDDARALFQLLGKAGWQGEYIPFAGGHEIPLPVVEAIQRLLERQ